MYTLTLIEKPGTDDEYEVSIEIYEDTYESLTKGSLMRIAYGMMPEKCFLGSWKILLQDPSGSFTTLKESS